MKTLKKILVPLFELIYGEGKEPTNSELVVFVVMFTILIIVGFILLK